MKNHKRNYKKFFLFQFKLYLCVSKDFAKQSETDPLQKGSLATLSEVDPTLPRSLYI